jgi:hypothetical protein
VVDAISNVVNAGDPLAHFTWPSNLEGARALARSQPTAVPRKITANLASLVVVRLLGPVELEPGEPKAPLASALP